MSILDKIGKWWPLCWREDLKFEQLERQYFEEALNRAYQREQTLREKIHKGMEVKYMGLKIVGSATQDTEFYLEAGAEAGTIDLVTRTPKGQTVPLMNFKAGGKVTRYTGVPVDFVLPVTRSGRIRVVLYR